ncbi:unnamed protein product [Orchesella dallaii]|uniref:Uncharacterized protein n=1 Tax=Orchesella dallaii TaxID=48710 RepID=A0ABP1Q1B5_9HEXA
MALTYIFFIWSLIFVFMGDSADSQATCGLEGITSTPENRFRLPIVSDNIVNRTLIWQHRFFGAVARTSSEAHPHFQYIDATHTSSYYRFYSNARTRHFTTDMNSREIHRNTTIHCQDGTSSAYFLEIPLEDMTPPEFSESLYTIELTTDWDMDKPISDGHSIIVSDNAYELGNEDLNKSLIFQTTEPDLLHIVPHKLWTEPNPEKFSFKLDLYFREGYILEPGYKLFGLSASDDYNSMSTIIEIMIS